MTEYGVAVSYCNGTSFVVLKNFSPEIMTETQARDIFRAFVDAGTFGVTIYRDNEPWLIYEAES